MYLKIVKPFFDYLFSVISLVVVSPLFILISLVLLFTGDGRVWFIQKRSGYNGKSFSMFKFRTMTNKTDDKGQLLSAPKRLTWLGSWLRRSSFDELPQLFNVLKGEMSIVGPRPLPIEYLPLYSDWQRQRFTVKPGITGWTQVNGRHSANWQKKFEMDNHYIQNLSLGLDLQILLKTIVLLLSFQKDISLEEVSYKGEDRQ